MAIATTSPRSWRTPAAPIACACGIAAAAAYVAAVDPVSAGVHLPACPFHEMTGLWCPGCGLTRAAHAAMRGRIAEAFGFNLFFPVFALMIAGGWLLWLRRSLGRPAPRWVSAMPASAPIALGIVFIAYGVLRNLPGLEALAP